MRKEFNMDIQRGFWTRTMKVVDVVSTSDVSNGRIFNVPASGDLTLEEMEQFKNVLEDAIKFAKG